MKDKGLIQCIELRYNFKNSKISAGLDGISRIFLPSSRIYPTLVASDTNDYVTDINIEAENVGEFKEKFMKYVYTPKKYRKISKTEALRIQGFPDQFILPEIRSRWMKLLGNSVVVPVVQMIARSVINTGVFEDKANGQLAV